MIGSELLTSTRMNTRMPFWELGVQVANISAQGLRKWWKKNPGDRGMPLKRRLEDILVCLVQPWRAICETSSSATPHKNIHTVKSGIFTQSVIVSSTMSLIRKTTWFKYGGLLNPGRQIAQFHCSTLRETTTKFDLWYSKSFGWVSQTLRIHTQYHPKINSYLKFYSNVTWTVILFSSQTLENCIKSSLSK